MMWVQCTNSGRERVSYRLGWFFCWIAPPMYVLTHTRVWPADGIVSMRLCPDAYGGSFCQNEDSGMLYRSDFERWTVAPFWHSGFIAEHLSFLGSSAYARICARPAASKWDYLGCQCRAAELTVHFTFSGTGLENNGLWDVQSGTCIRTFFGSCWFRKYIWSVGYRIWEMN